MKRAILSFCFLILSIFCVFGGSWTNYPVSKTLNPSDTILFGTQTNNQLIQAIDLAGYTGSNGPPNITANQYFYWKSTTSGNAIQLGNNYSNNFSLNSYLSLTDSNILIVSTNNFLVYTGNNNNYRIFPQLNKYDYSGIYYWSNSLGYYFCPGKIGSIYYWSDQGSWVMTTNIYAMTNAADGSFADSYNQTVDYQTYLFGYWADFLTGINNFSVNFSNIIVLTNSTYTEITPYSIKSPYVSIANLNMNSNSSIYFNGTVPSGYIDNLKFINGATVVAGNTISSTQFNAFLDIIYTNTSTANSIVTVHPRLFFTNSVGSSGLAAYVDYSKKGECSITTTTNTPIGSSIGELTISVPKDSTFYFSNVSTGTNNYSDSSSINGTRANFQSFDGTFPVFLRINDLISNINYNLSSRTNGKGYIFVTGKSTNTGQDGIEFFTSPTNIAVPANFFLKDVTNITGAAMGSWSVGYGKWMVAHAGIPLSPWHCIGAAHVGGPGGTNLWLLPDGKLYTNKVLYTYTIPSTDMMISLMDKTNPYVVKWLPDILWKTENNNIANSNSLIGVLFHPTSLVTNYTVFLEPMYQGGFYNGIAYLNICTSPTNAVIRFGDYSVGNIFVGGDSGAPNLTVIKNEAVYLFSTYTPGGGPSPGASFVKVNAAMNYLSTNYSAPVYKIQLYDLSQFYDY
jgi:hypothetical protein